jgi:hypothetical protein
MSKKLKGVKPLPGRKDVSAKRTYLMAGLLVGLVVGTSITVVLIYSNKGGQVNDVSNYHPATMAVAEKFMCGCPSCDIPLDECECGDPNGGVAEKNYISEQLKIGMSEEQVMKEVYVKFDRIKQEYQHLLKKNE